MTTVQKASSCSLETPLSRCGDFCVCLLLCLGIWGRFYFWLGFVLVWGFLKYPLESPSWNTGPACKFQPYSSPLK